MKKTILFPKMFTRLFELYKQHQDQIRLKKITFLEQQAFQYFYDLQETQEISCNVKQDSGVDIPQFLKSYNQEKRRVLIAKENASKAVLEVIKNNRVNECYSKRKAQLKKMKKVVR